MLTKSVLCSSVIAYTPSSSTGGKNETHFDHDSSLRIRCGSCVGTGRRADQDQCRVCRSRRRVLAWGLVFACERRAHPAMIFIHGGGFRARLEGRLRQHLGALPGCAWICCVCHRLSAVQAKSDDLAASPAGLQGRVAILARKRRNAGRSIPSVSASAAIPRARRWPPWWRSRKTCRSSPIATRWMRTPPSAQKSKWPVPIYAVYDMMAASEIRVGTCEQYQESRAVHRRNTRARCPARILNLPRSTIFAKPPRVSAA